MQGSIQNCAGARAGGREGRDTKSKLNEAAVITVCVHETQQTAGVGILKMDGRCPLKTINLDLFNISVILGKFLLASVIHRKNSAFPGFSVT